MNTNNRLYFDDRLEQKDIAAMNGNFATTTWPLRGIKSTVGTGKKGPRKYLVAVVLDVVLPVVSAAAASAITKAVGDFMFFLRRVTLKRASDAYTIKDVSGWDTFVRDACLGNGFTSSFLPANIAVNANATTTARARIVIPCGDDGKLAPMGRERFYRAWPFAAFVGSAGQLEIEWTQPLGHTGITTTAGTVKPTLVYALRDDAYMPPDVRLASLDTGILTTQRGIELPGGYMDSLVYAPRKLGGETLTDVVIDGEPYANGAMFPRRDAIGDDNAAPSANYPSYQELHLMANGLRESDIDASSINQIMERRVVPLWLPVGVAQTQRHFDAGTGVKLDVENTTNATNGHRFVYTTLHQPLEEDVDNICRELDIPKSKLIRRAALADARGAGDALPSSRRIAIGTQLLNSDDVQQRAAQAAPVVTQGAAAK